MVWHYVQVFTELDFKITESQLNPKLSTTFKQHVRKTRLKKEHNTRGRKQGNIGESVHFFSLMCVIHTHQARQANKKYFKWWLKYNLSKFSFTVVVKWQIKDKNNAMFFLSL